MGHRNSKKNKLKNKLGKSPGTLIYTGNNIEGSEITLVEYNSDLYEKKEISNLDDLEEISRFAGDDKIRWLNICGVNNPQLLEKFSTWFKIHPLTMEDIVNIYSRPKIDYYENYVFISLKNIDHQKGEESLKLSHINIILKEGNIFSFQDSDKNIFANVVERIKQGRGTIKTSKVDYLLYTLLDFIVDNYILELEEIAEEIEALEDRLLDQPKKSDLSEIGKLKREFHLFRQSMWPLREILASLVRRDSLLIEHTTVIYMRDVLDHQNQILETLESYRDMLMLLMDIYLSSISNKMNEVMKILTMIATIFIPLTFIVGVYGMNFQFMPELGWKYGYLFAWVVMLVIGISFGLYFKKKHWF
ncbi:MAG: magnesium/cobalt transporter CorA [bacterium]